MAPTLCTRVYTFFFVDFFVCFFMKQAVALRIEWRARWQSRHTYTISTTCEQRTADWRGGAVMVTSTCVCVCVCVQNYWLILIFLARHSNKRLTPMDVKPWEISVWGLFHYITYWCAISTDSPTWRWQALLPFRPRGGNLNSCSLWIQLFPFYIQFALKYFYDSVESPTKCHCK